MTELRSPRRRRGLAFARAIAVASVAAVGLAVGNSGTASAAVDGSQHVVDHGGNTIEAQTVDTAINFVPPLDGNVFTREWFHSGRAAFKITGPDADDFEGHITMGYQVGYPATFDGHITAKYQTPDLELDLDSSFAPSFAITNLIPVVGFDVSVGPGPGIVDVPAAEGDVSGAEGDIALTGFQGTVTGVVGPTSIRPYVKLVSSAGDTVVAYGPIFRN
ncbi:MspA family porin [Skermania piniformis]|uniref:MspA family porin n=1 Tax=Skermania pinensis TaxID=39122 RepID=A0ABX8S7G3_9ACTN|nr:MspA family porin [Skermania piniformis]QXQ13206.1 MspA family porin [Skermania piniformis]